MSDVIAVEELRVEPKYSVGAIRTALQEVKYSKACRADNEKRRKAIGWLRENGEIVRQVLERAATCDPEELCEDPVTYSVIGKLSLAALPERTYSLTDLAQKLSLS